MIFNSVTFLVFFGIVLLLYYILPWRPRLLMLFAASIIFYGFWQWKYAWLMIASIVLDYVCSIMINRTDRSGIRRFWLLCSICGNLGMLFFFKYLMFAVRNTQSLFQMLGLDIELPHPEIVLPLGISFYTFQTMSYTIDVYRRFIPAERNLILFSTYVVFFPQLVAGPILRASEVIPKLIVRPPLRTDNLIFGAKRILNGLFLKVVVADNIAGFVDDGFGQNLTTLSALDSWTLCFLFGFQIYFDFSAYSHIALGTSKMMGIEFPENFNFPYFSRSPREFWKRWHISLSSWIRDYLYLPLCGVTVQDQSVGGLPTEQGKQRSATIALFLTWAIMGMWHGANWTFLYWGIFHASWIYLYRVTIPFLNHLPPALRSATAWPFTLMVVMASWAPFRAETLSDAFLLQAKLLNPASYTWLGMRENTYLVAAAVFIGMCMVYSWSEKSAFQETLNPGVRLVTSSVSWGIQLALVYIFLRPVNQFIYFQF